jgi:3-isopropylmalate dehydratase small subunit
VDDSVVQYLLGHPDHAVRIDISGRTLSVEGYGEFEFPLDPFSAYCLTRGIDPLDFILQNEGSIESFEKRIKPL